MLNPSAVGLGVGTEGGGRGGESVVGGKDQEGDGKKQKMVVIASGKITLRRSGISATPIEISKTGHLPLNQGNAALVGTVKSRLKGNVC